MTSWRVGMFVLLFLFLFLLGGVSSFSLSPEAFYEHVFKQKLQSTVSQIQKVLSSEKQPLLAAASEVPHEYADKYSLTELLGNIAITSTVMTLKTIGLQEDKLREAVAWSHAKDVSLKFSVIPDCVFDREVTREVEGDKLVEEQEVVRICSGSARNEQCTELLNDSSQQTIITSSNARDRSPLGTLLPKSKEFSLTPLLKLLDASSLLSVFSIKRNSSSCLTPVRNTDVEQLLSLLEDTQTVSEELSSQIQELYAHSTQKKYFAALFSGNDKEIFTPIVPIFQSFSEDMASSNDNKKQRSRLLDSAALNTLLQEEEASLNAKRALFDGVSSQDIISPSGAKLLVSLHHLHDISAAFQSSMLYVEDMIRDQLLAAIGRQDRYVTARDLAEYSHFYLRKLLQQEAMPQPLAHSVRRTHEHSPEGMFKLDQSFPYEQQGLEASSPLPLHAFSMKVASSSAKSSNARSVSSEAPLSFALDASTSIRLDGDQFLHAYLHHSFSSPRLRSGLGRDEAKLLLSAQARQFSSFVLLLGKLSSSSSFDPQHAFVLRSRDEVKAALNLAVIPTQKEFRDSIRSLSRNQQSFANAFRSMQLEGSLFGVVVVQIKPQLERVLNLPPQSLQQEIELTESLMELFIDYQIPPDLVMSPPSSNHSSSVQHVKTKVKEIQEMIERSAEKDLKKKRQHDEYHNIRSPRAGQESATLEDNDDGAVQYKHQKKRSSKASYTFSSMAAIPPAQQAVAEADVADAAGAATGAVGGSARSSGEQGERKSPVQNIVLQGGSEGGAFDYTALPQRLQDAFELHGGGDTLRPTIITVDEQSFTQESQKNLFTPATKKPLSKDSLQREKRQAFDLLDALTRSGALTLTEAALHVVVTATHVFDKSVLETLVQEDVNPLQRLEQSLLVMLSTTRGAPLDSFVTPRAAAEVRKQYPQLFANEKSEDTTSANANK